MPATLENLEDAILPLVSKPNRYLGNFAGACRKDHGHVSVKVALAFPDCFDLAMSHLGIKILYRIINERDDSLAELVFAPWTDMEDQLRTHELPLFTLETRTPIAAFDVVGFSLQYELHYTTVLNMLDQGGIPIFSEDRGEEHPLVLAGGPCAFAPEPMAPFIDAFLIGDGEEAVIGILEEVAHWRQGAKDRAGLLRSLAEIEGVYVPSLYSVAPNSRGHLVPEPRDGLPGRIKAARIRELSAEVTEPAHLVPLTDVTHSRLSVEVMRGCPRTCRFCMPGTIYRPVRRKAQADILLELQNGMASGGWEEVSLLSLSTSDYKGVTGLVQDVSKLFLGRGVNISLPSMRPGTLSPQLVRTLAYVRKSGLTFAPEAGTERLRRVIDKDIGEDEMTESIKIAAAAGWHSVKLYFMVGLPTETHEDLRGIARLVARLKSAARAGKRRMAIKVSVAGFAPKPHTAFQWEEQLSLEDMSCRIASLNRLMRSRNVKMRWRDPETTFLEGLLSRGDRRMAGAIHLAWKKGCRFDGWSDQLRFDKWQEALQEAGIEPGSYLAAREVSEPQPWSHIAPHVTHDHLVKEREKAYSAARRHPEDGVTPRAGRQPAPSGGRDLADRSAEGGSVGGWAGASRADATSWGEDAPGAVSAGPEKAVELHEPGGKPSQQVALFGRTRRRGRAGAKRASTCFRLKYVKLEPVRFISHLDVVRTFDRAFRRARLPIAFSQGFSKHPKLSFGPPLAVGMTSTAEYLDLEFSLSQTEDFRDSLSRCLPDGLHAVQVEPHGDVKPDSLMSSISAATFRVQFSEYLLSRIEEDNPAASLEEALSQAGDRLHDLGGRLDEVGPDGRETDGGNGEPGWRRVVIDGSVGADVTSPSLNLTVRLNVRKSPRVEQVAKGLLFPLEFDPRLLRIERSGLWVERAGSLLSPFELLATGVRREGPGPSAGREFKANV